MKKLTMQLLSESLGLSRVTVWKVLNNKEGVAPETAKRVLEAAALLKKEHEDALFVTGDKPRNVTLLMRRVENSMFWMSILDQLIIDCNKRKVTLDYVPYSPSETMPPALINKLEKTDGLLVVNFYDARQLGKIADMPLPKVFYDTAPGLTASDLKGDLLMTDGESPVYLITEDLIKRGCRRLGFIGDVNNARTFKTRWDGFKAACDGHGVTINPAFCFTKSASDYPTETEVLEYLNGLAELPDCFVCANDHMACLAYNILHEKRCRIPNDLLLTGFDDSREFMLEYHNITTVRVKKSLLGRRLISQLVYRMENPEADWEEIFIQPGIIFRG